MRTRRIVMAAVTVSALVAGGATIVALARSQAEPPGCDDIRAYQERYGEIETLGEGAHEITVLGDSYSAGDTLRARGQRWTDALTQLDAELTVTLDAVPFTGFVNSGACGPNAFTDRIDRAVAAADDVLVVQGGLNDVEAQPEDVADAAARVLDAADGVTHVLVVGPVDAPARDGERAIDAALERAAAAHGARYVSALAWDLPFGADRLHLTAAGHHAYAERVLEELRAAGAI
ncbi:SGNH/GDSL hydrolase family protein [Microbacterium sp. JZ31]|uniref:SGNH/GDSL hydrolase family protein n=1 Tax=Microbacterium sp. JZ31 TaxID=1906274 RepID=UPI001932D589|nr:SGNH/GDSL hydrolase family protein [Microbacterium sp. JZ31]